MRRLRKRNIRVSGKSIKKSTTHNLLLAVMIISILAGSGYAMSKVPKKDSNLASSVTRSIPDELDRDQFASYIQTISGDYENTKEAPVWEGQPLSFLPSELDEKLDGVLGESVTADDGSEKWIKISLADMKLWAMEGDRVVYEIPISSGRPGYPTVRGEFRVWRKTRYQRYLSRNPKNPYNLPNVPCSMFFKSGYAIHGAYWHNDFGIKNRSSGCVNVSVDNACLLYSWAGPDTAGKGSVNASASNPGVRVVVY